MERRPLVEYLLTDGIHTSGVKSVERTSTMAKGTKNVIMTGFDKPNAYKGTELLSGKNGARVMMPVGDSYGGIGAYGDTSALGSMTRMLAALFFSGAGAVFYDGLPLGKPDATSVLQLRVLENGVWSKAYNAGLAAPSSAVIAARDSLGAGMTGRNKNGTFSVRITKIRSTTGARSNASETSNIVIVSEVDGKGKSMRVTFPVIGTNGADAWGLYVSPKNFGSTGAHFLLREILESELTTIDGVPRSFEIEWTDGDLVGSSLAPIESNPPPPCVFNGAMGDAFFVDGCYGDIGLGVSAGAPGSTIAVSLPGRPEEFPADSLLFPPEPPTALIRGGEGFYYRFGKNSMGVVSYTGGNPPLNFQLYWATTGISYPHNACVAEGGRLYAKTGARGICRLAGGGEIDASFANDVIDEFGDWLDEDTVLGWDENSQNVCFMNNFDVWCFNSSQQKWGYVNLSGKISGKIVSAVTQEGALYIGAESLSTSSIQLYKFNSGTGTVYEQRTDWHFAKETEMIRQIDITMRSDTLNPVELKIYADESDAAPLRTISITPVKTGLVKLKPVLISTKYLQSFLVHLKQQAAGKDCGIESVKVSGIPRLITR